MIARTAFREIVTTGLGLRYPQWPGQYYKITAISGADLTIPSLEFDLGEAHAAEDFYFNHEKTWNEDNHIRVDSWDVGTGVVKLVAAPAGVSQDDYCDFYIGAPPAEANQAMDEALSSLWYEDTEEVTLTADQNEVELTTAVSWLTRSSQLIELIYRETKATSKLAARPVAEFDYDDYLASGAPKVRLYLWDVPTDVTNVKLLVKGRHHYDALASETTSTLCPQPLAVAAAKIALIKRLPNRLKDQYLERLAIFRNDLAEARLQFLPLSADRPLRRRYYWRGPEVPVESWSW